MVYPQVQYLGPAHPDRSTAEHRIMAQRSGRPEASVPRDGLVGVVVEPVAGTTRLSVQRPILALSSGGLR